MTMQACPSEIAELRSRFAAGDPAAEAQLYERFAPGLKAVVRRFLRRRIPASPLERMCAHRLAEDECIAPGIRHARQEEAIARRLLKSLLAPPPPSESALSTRAVVGATRSRP